MNKDREKAREILINNLNKDATRVMKRINEVANHDKVIDAMMEFISGDIFLIERGWIDPMENKNADGYIPFKYALTEQEARDFCDSQGYWTEQDCWSIQFKPGMIMPKFRYKRIEKINNI